MAVAVMMGSWRSGGRAVLVCAGGGTHAWQFAAANGCAQHPRPPTSRPPADRQPRIHVVIGFLLDLLGLPTHCCSYFFDRPDDEAPEAAASSNSLASSASRRAASKSFGGHMATAAGKPKGERALRLGGDMAFAFA